MTADSPSPDPTDGSQGQTAAGAAGSPPLGFSASVQPPPQAREAAETASTEVATAGRQRKGPLSFLSGALTSGLLAWLCLGLSGKVLAYYEGHPPHYSAQIAQSIATALKTLIVGMCFLATFSFAFIGLGLALTFLRSLLPARDAEGTS